MNEEERIALIDKDSQNLTTDGANQSNTEDHSCRRGIKVKMVEREREINLLLVVEDFRLLFWGWYMLLILIGIILTHMYVKENYKMRFFDVFGALSICVYFDYPPSTYVLTIMWSVSLLIISIYIIASIFCAWIAKEEGKISRVAFYCYNAGLIYIFLSFIIFSIIFAVQPDPSDPYTMWIHTLPFTNLMYALWIFALLVTWFGLKVAWCELNLPGWFIVATHSVWVGQSLTVPLRTMIQINALR